MMTPALVRVGVLIGLVAMSSTALGLTCFLLQDRYVVSCGDHGCSARFRARDVPGLCPCSRGLVVEKVPASIESKLIADVANAVRVSGAGLYQITYRHSYWWPDPSVADVSAWGPPSIVPLMVPEASVRGAFQERASVERWFEWMRWLFEIVLAGVVARVLLFSVALFRRSLRVSKDAWGVSGIPIIIQLGMLALGVAGRSGFGCLIAIALSAPVALAILLIEMVVWIVVSVRRRSAV